MSWLARRCTWSAPLTIPLPVARACASPSCRARLSRTFRAAGVARRLTYEIDDLETLIELVGHGAAVAVLPPSVLPRGSRLATSRIRRPAPEFVISIAAPATRRPSFAARGLLDFLLSPASG